MDWCSWYVIQISTIYLHILTEKECNYTWIELITKR